MVDIQLSLIKPEGLNCTWKNVGFEDISEAENPIFIAAQCYFCKISAENRDGRSSLFQTGFFFFLVTPPSDSA